MHRSYGLIAASIVHLLQETAVAASNGNYLRGYAQTLASNQAPASGEDERPIVRHHDPDDEEDEGPSLESDVELERRRGRGRGRSGGRRRRGRGGRRRRRGRGSFRSRRRGRRFRGSRRGRSFRRGRRFSRRRGGFGGSRRCIDRCLDRPNRSSRSCENRCGFSSESIVDLFYATGGFSEAPTDEDLGLYLSATPSADLPVNVPSDDGEFDDYDDEPDYFDDDDFDDDDFEDSQDGPDDSIDEPQKTNKTAAANLRDVHMDASDDYYYGEPN